MVPEAGLECPWSYRASREALVNVCNLVYKKEICYLSKNDPDYSGTVP